MKKSREINSMKKIFRKTSLLIACFMLINWGGIPSKAIDSMAKASDKETSITSTNASSDGTSTKKSGDSAKSSSSISESSKATTSSNSISESNKAITSSNGISESSKAIISNNTVKQADSISSQEDESIAINVRCSAKTSSSTTLEWDKINDNSDSVTYEIYMASRKIGTSKSENKYTVNGLVSGKSYKFYILAKDKDSNVLAKSNTISVTAENEEVSGDTPNDPGKEIKPETLIYVENQDFSKDISGLVEVNGCFLSQDTSSVNAKVFIDDLEITNQIEYFLVGTDRADLAAKYPNYINSAKAGFSFDFDTYSVSNGKHTLKLKFHDTIKEFTINVNNINKQLVLDNSDYSEIQNGEINVSGYILSSYDPSLFDDGIENANVYIDGVRQFQLFDNSLKTQLIREDVIKNYPDYKFAARCGFSFKLDIGKLSSGKHTIKLKFLSMEKEFTINVQNNYSDIVVEGIDINQIQSGVIKGTGYVLSSYDPNTFNNPDEWITNCDLYVDSKYVGGSNLKTQIKRDDVKQKYPDYNYSDKCGYSFTINTLELPNGKHTIKLSFRGLEKELTINVQNNTPTMVVDGIDINKPQSGNVKGTGYIVGDYDPSIINDNILFSFNCYVYVDGEHVYRDEILTQLNREDVKQKYPNYRYPDKCGFSFNIDTLGLSNGQHKVKIKIMNSESEFTINVQNTKSDIVIEGIDNNQQLEGIITGKGYILSDYDPSDFKSSWMGECDVFIDNLGQNELFDDDIGLKVQLPRDDVKQKYPDYKYADRCGFSFKIDTGKFANGKHKLKIKLKNVEKEVEININNKPSDIVVESVNKSNEGSGKLVISGYQLTPYSTAELTNTDYFFSKNNSASIDGNDLSTFAIFSDPEYQITLGIGRNDIKSRYPDYKYSDVSGFEAKIDNSALTKLTNGSHIIKISFRNVSKEFSFMKGNNVGDPLFDPVFYADKYPDLKDAFGYDEGALYNHFLTYGIKEGRCSSALFDVKYYLENNADLVAAFGATNYEAAYNHFKIYGYRENRKLSPILDMKYYCDNNPDVVQVFGEDYYSRITHFINYGMSEGRTGSENFNLEVYKNRYPDLVRKYGDNKKLYYMDYVTSGISEGRTGR